MKKIIWVIGVLRRTGEGWSPTQDYNHPEDLFQSRFTFWVCNFTFNLWFSVCADGGLAFSRLSFGRNVQNCGRREKNSNEDWDDEDTGKPLHPSLVVVLSLFFQPACSFVPSPRKLRAWDRLMQASGTTPTGITFSDCPVVLRSEILFHSCFVCLLVKGFCFSRR